MKSDSVRMGRETYTEARKTNTPPRARLKIRMARLTLSGLLVMA